MRWKAADRLLPQHLRWPSDHTKGTKQHDRGCKDCRTFFNRNEQGIQELDSKYGRLFRKLSYNILQNREDAEECVNDSYLGAWYKIPPEKPLSLVTYVCRIVRNLSLKRYYAVTAQKRDSRLCIALEEMEDCLADMNEPEAHMEVS